MRPKFSVFAPTLIALALVAGRPPAARAQAASVDAHAEAAAALSDAAATLAAAQTADEVKIRADQGQVAALAAQVKAGDVSRTAELAAAQEALVARLAQQDRAYAQTIAVLRDAVTGIASTPAGAAALARYNGGDQAGALAALDTLQAADEAAGQKGGDAEKAAGERRIGELALDALRKGKADTASVIARFERVTKLDPTFAGDWLQLARLYQDAERMADARRAAEQATKTAANDPDRSAALNELGDLLAAGNDAAGARKAYGESLDILRRLAAADPGDAGLQHDLSVLLNKTGDVLAALRDGAPAVKAYQESLDILRRLAAADPDNGGLQRELYERLWRSALANAPWARWRDVVAQLKTMDRHGFLQPADQPYLKEARKRAAAQETM